MRLLFVLFSTCSLLTAQAQHDTLPRGFSGAAYLSNRTTPLAVKQFYTVIGHPFPWMAAREQQGVLTGLLHMAAQHGLNEQDYPVNLLDSLYQDKLRLPALADTLRADTLFTETALQFFHDLALGDAPPVSYPGLQYDPDCLDIPGLLALALGHHQLQELPEALAPPAPDYKALRFTLQQLLAISRDTASNDSTRRWLTGRLADWGLLPSALQTKQRMEEKIQELKRSLNTLRWTRCLQEQQCIFVNIPSATLQYYAQGQPVLQSKVIVGKRSTPTSTLSSEVKEVILYPYWTVPPKIASRELLPLIKRNPAFLDENAYQVIRAGKVIDPATVDWTKYSSTYFPLTLRQSTGCDNSLGIIKLNFYSPYGIYLHDTPWKSLFNLSRRYLSHGCVRVEKVTELTRQLLQADSTVLDEIIRKGDSLNTRPTTLTLQRPVPLIILYQTAWTDPLGNVRFYEDVYEKTGR